MTNVSLRRPSPRTLTFQCLTDVLTVSLTTLLSGTTGTSQRNYLLVAISAVETGSRVVCTPPAIHIAVPYVRSRWRRCSRPISARIDGCIGDYRDREYIVHCHDDRLGRLPCRDSIHCCCRSAASWRRLGFDWLWRLNMGASSGRCCLVHDTLCCATYDNLHHFLTTLKLVSVPAVTLYRLICGYIYRPP
jgi:hypothetical protein